ncbi:hypothetical protein B7494_g1492 [Chlorociboria aeruginascens]|nr:hypothetical protein B7494_g1492 [Chlorociboria aeruginascens]
MFSPSLNGPPSTSIRSSRRRQRPLSNEGSIAQPKAKRLRSALSEQTFVAPDGTSEMEEVRNHKIPKRENSREFQGSRREIAMRGKNPKTGERGSKGDGSVILTTNDTYTVSKLPALPDRLRTDTIGRQHGAVYSDNGYALTLTHFHAIVWEYAAHIPSPETFTFDIPNPSKHVTDALPLGSLVSASSSSEEPGLVIVIPTTGYITYWESIASAATLNLMRQQRNGVEFTIPGTFSGERVIQILNAETAGFILGFSTGRLAYMSVRDGQGRPAISVQFLRGTNGGPGSGGIFGSLRNALTSSTSRGDIAAVRAERADRHEKVGQRNVVVATKKGRLQVWDIHRGGHNSIQAETDGREAIVMAIKETQASLGDIHLESFQILDFSFAPKSVADTQLSDQDDTGTHLLILTSLTNNNSSYYSLVEVVLKQNELTIGSVRPIKSYMTPVSQNATSKPRLYLPKPALVAYVVFDRAVVVISMARQPDSPDWQLRSESHVHLQSFEDVVDFREDMNIEIVGSGMEEPYAPLHGIEDSRSRRYKAKFPAAILIVRGGGVVRVAAINTARLISSKAQQVTARSKLEQAVFFGSMEQNPLSFSVRPELQFPPDEVATAAVSLSQDILKSQIPYIPSVPASIEQNLRKRSAALHDLAKHLKETGLSLDRVTKWKLLWDAEKMAAAARIWKDYDARVRTKPEGQKRGLLTDVVEHIHEIYKTEPVAEAGELDRVRQWFIRDIWNLEIAIPWAYQVIKYTYQDGQKDHEFVMEILSEANDLVKGALKTAFNFRSDNLGLYNLQGETLENGILQSGYEGLPEFWTSIFYLVENTRKQTELSGLLVKEYWGKPPGPAQPDPSLVDKIRLENGTLVDLAIRTNRERIRWNSVQGSHELQIEAEQINSSQKIAEEDQLKLLAVEIGLADEAINLAEKYEILPTLATILMYEIGQCGDKSREVGLGIDEIEYYQRRVVMLQNRLTQCYEEFGTDWATALYGYYIRTRSMSELFNNNPEQHKFLTEFLRNRPQYAKIAWIQEVTKEHDFDQAAHTILDLGLHRERDLWCKKVQLSLGKLARMAGRKYSQSNGVLIPDGGQADLVETGNQLNLIKIQEQAYNHILPSIDAAIDEKAELQLAMEAHGNKGSKRHPLSNLLEESMAHLINHEAMDALSLIDLLTLMGDNRQIDHPDSFRSCQFYLALQVTCYGDLSKEDRVPTQKVIWRRCLLRDDWKDINNTDLKDDQQVEEHLRTTALYSTLRSCFKNGLLGKDSSVQPISPEGVLGAFTDEVDHRFEKMDISIQDQVTRAMQSEDDALKPLIEASRLDKWYHTAFDLAKQGFKDEINDETGEGGKMRRVAEKLREIERGITESERRKAKNLLHSKPRYRPVKSNGSPSHFKSSVEEY